jgi:hypothetical protein
VVWRVNDYHLRAGTLAQSSFDLFIDATRKVDSFYLALARLPR